MQYVCSRYNCCTLYRVMHFDSKNPEWDERDRFILSKGHAGAAIYAALAENGFFPVEELKTHYQNGSRLSGHVSHHLPEWIFLQVLWDMDYLQQLGWRMLLRKMGKDIRSMLF